MKKDFGGLYTALVTPFNEKKNVDFEALQLLVERQIKGGVDGIVILGTTGERPTVSTEESKHIIERVVELAKNRVSIIVGTGSNDTKKTLQNTIRAKELGADAVLLVNPYYNKPSQKGLYQHFSFIADNVDIPMLLYNIAGRSGVNMQTGTVLELARHKNIIGVKEASGDINQIMDVISMAPESFVVLSGDDALTYTIMNLGGHGVVSVTSNILPKEMNEILRSNSRDMHYKLYPLMKALLSLDSNPVPIKVLIAHDGYIKEEYRLPLTAMDASKKQELIKLYKELKNV